MAVEDSLDTVQPENTESSENGHPSDVPAEAPPAEEYMGVAEASRQLRTPEQAIRYYVKKGLLEGKREGKEWMIARQSVHKFSELMDGSGEGYAWLFQDYNRLLNNYLELIRENNRLSEQAGFLKAKEQFLLEYKNSLEAKEREAENLRKSLVRSEKISRALQAVAEELEEQNAALLNHNAQADGQGRHTEKLEPDRAPADTLRPQIAAQAEAGEADHHRQEDNEKTLNGALGLSQERLKELSSKNRDLTEQVGALSEEVQRMKDRNDELTEELARLYGELREWRNMSFWRRVFLGRVR